MCELYGCYTDAYTHVYKVNDKRKTNCCFRASLILLICPQHNYINKSVDSI